MAQDVLTMKCDNCGEYMGDIITDDSLLKTPTILYCPKCAKYLYEEEVMNGNGASA